MELITLNRCCRIRIDERPGIDLLLERKSFTLPSAELIAPLLESSEPRSYEAVVSSFVSALENHNPADVKTFVDSLLKAGVLQDALEDNPLLDEAKLWHSYGWTDALVFHCLSDEFPRSDVPGTEHFVPIEESLKEDIAIAGTPEFWRYRAQDYTALPEASDAPVRDLAEVLLARRTHQPWTGAAFSAQDLSRVLRDVNDPLLRLRQAAEDDHEGDPGALLRNTFGDLEAYVAVHDIDGIAPGLYHYDPKDHALGVIRQGDHRELLQRTFVGQTPAGQGRCAIIISVVWSRLMFKYRSNPRAYRGLMTVVGQLAQRYLVSFTGFGLTTFPTPAHVAERADALLGTDRLEESALYLVSAG